MVPNKRQKYGEDILLYLMPSPKEILLRPMDCSSLSLLSFHVLFCTLVLNVNVYNRYVYYVLDSRSI